jgi:DNA-binding transcriptional ArsR family regulator
MSDVRDPSDEGVPDYDLEPTVRADTPTRLKALAHPVRNAILHLVVERAATTSELATATGKSHGTVAHHLKVLEDAGLVRVVRTRQVRAVTERFWGRTGRTIMVDERAAGDEDHQALFVREAAETFRLGDHGYTTLRYARVAPEHVDAFGERLDALVQEFLRLPRAGATTYGLLVALQPTDQPALPDRGDGPDPADAPGDDAPGDDRG